MALGVMMVLAITSTTIIALSQSSESGAHRAYGGQRALALAEAGLAIATSRLYGSADPTSATAVESGSESLDGGTTSYSGLLTGTTWTLTGTGAVASPTAGAAPISRTVSRQFTVTTEASPWRYIFADSDTACFTVSNDSTVAQPIYVRGHLCMSNNSHLTGSPIHVEKTADLGTNATIGYGATPVASANVAGGCITSQNATTHACSAADRVYAQTLTATPGTLTKPAVDLPRWYANAKPGPSYSCTSGAISGGFDNDTTLNRSRVPFDLTPASGYTCSVVENGTTVGQLTWTPGNPGSLVVKGTVFFDGNLVVSGFGVISGRATIYASGTVSFNNNAKLCGVAGCDTSWDPLTNALFLVAGSSSVAASFTLNNNAVFQGGVYSVNDFTVLQNAKAWGPAIARTVTVYQSADQFMAIPFAGPGAPGTEATIHPVPASWNG